MLNRYAIVNDKGSIEGVATGPFKYIECEEHVGDMTHFYDLEDRVIKEKNEIEATFVSNGLVITFNDLPEGLTVKTNGMETDTDNEPLVIEYDVPGTYAISFSGLVNYLDHEMEVIVG
ncbi:hypothetical protein [Vreelandella alkaliphila]|uniref:hypothetical protein n=1 Tax=Vreelandella alkaliphila TaxID=272774 RepID=UPI003FD7B182